MIFEFETDDYQTATAALVVYAIYRSRDKRKFKVSVDMWAQIERFVKASAKRAYNVQSFINSLMPRLCCDSIKPKWMDSGMLSGSFVKLGGSLVEFDQTKDRQFLTTVINEADHRQVLDRLYKETTWVILIVRDRLEREKPIESKLEAEEAEEQQ